MRHLIHVVFIVFVTNTFFAKFLFAYQVDSFVLIKKDKKQINLDENFGLISHQKSNENDTALVSCSFITKPSGGSVFIDDKYIGIAPLQTVLLKPGSHILSIHRAGYLELIQNIYVTNTGNNEFFISLIQKHHHIMDSNFKSTLIKGVDYEMIKVQGGYFFMGCDDKDTTDFCLHMELPNHKTHLKDFYIGKYEVTQHQWTKVMGKNPSFFFKCDMCPVERVSWNDIQVFLKKLNKQTGKNYRLPTEAEWEYAASGGQIRSDTFTKYAGSNNIEDVAWFAGHSKAKSQPIGTKKPNQLGIYDMSGNVWEWCSDFYATYSGAEQLMPLGVIKGKYHVFRGGSWKSNPQYCRIYYRAFNTPKTSSSSLGFRLAYYAE